MYQLEDRRNKKPRIRRKMQKMVIVTQDYYYDYGVKKDDDSDDEKEMTMDYDVDCDDYYDVLYDGNHDDVVARDEKEKNCVGDDDYHFLLLLRRPPDPLALDHGVHGDDSFLNCGSEENCFDYDGADLNDGNHLKMMASVAYDDEKEDDASYCFLIQRRPFPSLNHGLKKDY